MTKIKTVKRQHKTKQNSPQEKKLELMDVAELQSLMEDHKTNIKTKDNKHK